MGNAEQFTNYEPLDPDILNNHHTKEALLRIEERVSKFD